MNPTTRRIYTPTHDLTLTYILPKGFDINESTINISVTHFEGLRSISEKEEKRIKESGFLKVYKDSEDRLNIVLSIINPLLFCKYTLDFESPLLDDLIRSGFLNLEQGRKIREYITGKPLNYDDKDLLKKYVLQSEI